MNSGPGAAVPVLTPVQVSACLDRLGADIAAVNAAITAGVLGDVASAALPETALRLLSLSDRARAAATVTVGRVHAAGVLAGEGFVSTKTWLRARARISEVEAGRLLARSRDLVGDYRVTADAWLAGEITADHVREITLGLRGAVSSLEASLRDALRARGQEVLVEIARAGSPEQVKAAAARLRNAADPDGASQDEMDAYDAQSIKLTPCAGGAVPNGPPLGERSEPSRGVSSTPSPRPCCRPPWTG
jgi:hypothetical protein